MWSYRNKISSLQEKASAQVAINLCQENGFKEVALRLEKPTYGGFICDSEPSHFVSDPEILSKWAKFKDKWSYYEFQKPCCLNNTEEEVRLLWDKAVDEQCRRLTEGMPDRLRQQIQPWINRIALEYLSYSRRQEVLFGVSRYFLMDIFTRGDWKEAARLDEKKLAKRLLKDERLTVLQRYRIACVYFLHKHIPRLWKRLTREEKRFTSGDGIRDLSEETHDFVLLWSRAMNANQQYCLRTTVSQVISYGNRAALMLCWKMMKMIDKNKPEKTVVYGALKSLQQWQSMEKESCVKQKLVSHQSPKEQSADSMKHFNLPSYYSEFMFFFLSQMDQDQQLIFFKEAFQSKYYSQRKNRKSVLECFLDWPHQDDFLPMINQLWGIIPKGMYGQCLLALASKYSGNDTKANCDFDCLSLLRALWEETPEEYKQYVFRDRKTDYSVINLLLLRLLERSPFREKDEALFKRIFRDQPQERRAMMHSKTGKYMCSLLMQKEKWAFLEGLLEECLSKEEIPDFKKTLFIQSDCGVKLCLDALKENREKLVEDLLDWSFESEAEKTRCKDELKDALISRNTCLNVCKSLLIQGKFADAERLINFCLSSDEKKEQFKSRFAQRACGALLENYTHHPWLEDGVWEEMDRIIAWSVDTEEKIRDFKKDLFSRERICIHDKLVFPDIVEVVWGKVERFYQWFDLSPEEIKQLKRDTVFTSELIQCIGEKLCDYTEFVAPLRWCLTEEEMVIDFKKEVEVYCTDVLDETGEMKKGQLDRLVSELLDGFRKEVQDKTSREGVGEKRSVGIEENVKIELSPLYMFLTSSNNTNAK